MKRIVSILLLLLAVSIYGIDAQNVLKSFSDKAASSRVSFSYNYAAKGKLPLKGKGNAVVQGESFILKGDGLEVWCDGKSRWTMDKVAKEAVAEAVDGRLSDYMTDPALLIASVEEHFNVISQENTILAGKSVLLIRLTPKVPSELKSLKIYFRDSIIVAAEVAVKDGTVTHFTITDLKFCKKSSGDDFRFNEKSLDSSWLVTDLR